MSHLVPPVGLENHVLGNGGPHPAAYEQSAPAKRKTFVSNTPRSAEETLQKLRILLREDRFDEAKDLIEYAYTTGIFR